MLHCTVNFLVIATVVGRTQVISPHEISRVKIRRKYEIHVYSFFYEKGMA